MPKQKTVAPSAELSNLLNELSLDIRMHALRNTPPLTAADPSAFTKFHDRLSGRSARIKALLPIVIDRALAKRIAIALVIVREHVEDLNASGKWKWEMGDSRGRSEDELHHNRPAAARLNDELDNSLLFLADEVKAEEILESADQDVPSEWTGMSTSAKLARLQDARRKSPGATQKELAQELGIHRGTLTRLLKKPVFRQVWDEAPARAEVQRATSDPRKSYQVRSDKFRHNQLDSD